MKCAQNQPISRTKKCEKSLENTRGMFKSSIQGKNCRDRSTWKSDAIRQWIAIRSDQCKCHCAACSCSPRSPHCRVGKLWQRKFEHSGFQAMLPRGAAACTNKTATAKSTLNARFDPFPLSKPHQLNSESIALSTKLSTAWSVS